MTINGSGIREYIAEVASREGKTSAAIVQRIKNGETFTTSYGISIYLMDQSIVAHSPATGFIDIIGINQISGGRRKKHRNTKKARRTRRTRRRSTRKN